MSKGESNFVFEEECLEISLVCLQMCLQVSTGGGNQTPKWFPSSPKEEIISIMTKVLFLMETYLIKMSARWLCNVIERVDKGISIQRQRDDKGKVQESICGSYEEKPRTYVGVMKRSRVQFPHHGIMNTRGLYHSIGP